MHSAAVILAVLAGGALAQPHKYNHHHLYKGRDVVVEVDTTVTVTAGHGPTPSSTVTAPTVTITLQPGQKPDDVGRKLAKAPATPSPAAAPVIPSPVAPPVQSAAPVNNQGNSGSSGNTGSSGSSSGNSFLDWHNQYRGKHQVGDYTWDSELASEAQGIANSCPNGDKVNGNYGSNWAGGMGYSQEALLELWYKEESDYAASTNNYQSSPPMGADGPTGAHGETGHFSQMVWKGSNRLGCAIASSCPSPNVVQITCLYGAPGNVGGEYTSNVFAPSS